MVKQDSTLNKAQDFVIENQYKLISLAALLAVLVGATFYHFVEKLSWLDAFYFCVITLTTIGYGDITPKTPIGKLFTIFYVLFGVGIIVAFTTTLVKRAGEHRKRRLEKK